MSTETSGYDSKDWINLKIGVISRIAWLLFLDYVCLKKQL